MEPIEEAEEISHCKPIEPPVKPEPKLSLSHTFRAFSHRNFRLFFAGQLVSLIGTWMNTTAEGWLVYQLTSSKELLGIVAAASSVPMLALATYGGSLADRLPKRTIIVWAQVGAMVLSLTLAFLVWGGSVQPWNLVVLSALGGVVMAFDMPARQSFVIEMTSREDMVSAISINAAMFNGARIIGPSIAGFVMYKVGIAWCFFIDGMSFIAVIIGLLMMRLPPHQTPERKKSAISESAAAFRYVWQSPQLMRIFTLFGIVGIFGWSYSVLMPAFAKDVLKLGEASYGMLLAANGFGALCGALSVAVLNQTVAPRKLALGGISIFSVAITLFALSHVLWMAMVCLAFSGFGLLLFFSSSNSAVQTSVPDAMRGRVMGIWVLVFGGVVPLGALEAGKSADWLGTPATIIIGAAACALAAAVTTFLGPLPKAETSVASTE